MNRHEDTRQYLRLIFYGVLTALVWGVFALDRGFWQDETNILVHLVGRDFWSPATWFQAGAGPTRRLQTSIYAVAWLSHRPVLFLQLAFGATWLGIGVLVERIAAMLFPGRPRLWLCAAALTLTASSDFLTDSLVMLGYNLAILTYLAAFIHLLRWSRGGSPWRLLSAAVLASTSVWLNEGALIPIAFSPLVVWLAHPREGVRRAAVGAVAWYAGLVPFAVVYARFLRDPASYAGRAVLSLDLAERSRRTLAAFGENFAFWHWVADRPKWIGTASPSILPHWVVVVAGGGAAALFALILRRTPPGAPEVGAWRRELAVAIICLGLAFLANAAFANLIMGDVFYRTQSFSRVAVSLALAVLACGTVWHRLRAARALALAAAVLFVGFGAAGAMERQDFYVASWVRHRRELASIIDPAPRLSSHARLLLHLPLDTDYEATEVPYLARGWMALLYDDKTMQERTFLWRPGAENCLQQADGLRCWGVGERDCFVAGQCDWTARYADLAVFAFVPGEGRYELIRALPDPRLPDLPDPAPDYAPEYLIRGMSPTPLARSLLDVSSPWGGWFTSKGATK